MAIKKKIKEKNPKKEKTNTEKVETKIEIEQKTIKGGIKKGEISVLIMPNEKYTKKINEVSKFLSDNFETVCYVSLNKIISSLEKGMKSAGTDLDKFLIIDGITKTIKSNPEAKDNIVYLDSAAALTQISLTIFKVLGMKKFDVLLFDSLSSLLVYNKSEIVGKFIHSIINRLKKAEVTTVFTALEGDTKSDLLKKCSMYVDNMIHIK